jgi:hypothetical protein
VAGAGGAAPSGASPSPSFVPPPSSSAPSPSSEPSSLARGPDVEGGTAQVIWEVAIVRDSPRTGQVLARLVRGTKIRLGSGEDGWYSVKYGSDFSSEGWVYRGAIGK